MLEFNNIHYLWEVWHGMVWKYAFNIAGDCVTPCIINKVIHNNPLSQNLTTILILDLNFVIIFCFQLIYKVYVVWVCS